MDSRPKQRVAVELAAALAVEEVCLVRPWLRRQPWDSNPSCQSQEPKKRAVHLLWFDSKKRRKRRMRKWKRMKPLAVEEQTGHKYG